MTPVIAYAMWQGWQALNHYCLCTGKGKLMSAYMFACLFVFGWVKVGPVFWK